MTGVFDVAGDAGCDHGAGAEVGATAGTTTDGGVMNHHCCGDLFRVHISLFWRCLLDGDITEVDQLADGDDCPNCNRPVSLPDRPIEDADIRLVRQAYVNGVWYTLPADEPVERERSEA
jgi:hypothetical protein